MKVVIAITVAAAASFIIAALCVVLFAGRSQGSRPALGESQAAVQCNGHAVPRMSASGARTASVRDHVLLRLAHIMIRELDSLGVRYYATQGTMLGALRDGRHIFGDEDVDLNVDCRDTPRIVAHDWTKFDIVMRRKGVNLFAQYYNAEGVYAYADLIPYTLENGVITPHEAATACHRFREEDVFPLVRKPFGDGVTVPVPKRSEEIIERLYGERWREPVAEPGMGKRMDCTEFTKDCVGCPCRFSPREAVPPEVRLDQ